MTKENISVLDDENGTFTFKCSNCGKTKKMVSPDRSNFKIKCPCGTKTSIQLNNRKKYRKPATLPITIITPEFRARGVMTDLSIDGISGTYHARHELAVDDQVKIEYVLKTTLGDVPVTEQATIKYVSGDNFGAHCEPLPEFSDARKHKGFLVMPPDQTLWLTLE
jgi:DNA-directed RNA polymerase subunit RPC12/RpoP